MPFKTGKTMKETQKLKSTLQYLIAQGTFKEIFVRINESQCNFFDINSFQLM